MNWHFPPKAKNYKHYKLIHNGNIKDTYNCMKEEAITEYSEADYLSNVAVSNDESRPKKYWFYSMSGADFIIAVGARGTSGNICL